MNKKSAKIDGLIDSFRGRDLDARYLGFFECFNRQLFFEAHDVLEELWLPQRSGPDNGFYKGLIQLAGAFVHLQKNRLKPAAALFRLAETNLQSYPAAYRRLDVEGILMMIAVWKSDLESSGFQRNPLCDGNAPKLMLSA